MGLDPRLTRALKTVAKELGQPGAVANRTIAWLEALASGNESLEDRDDVHQRLEQLYDAVKASDTEMSNRSGD